MTRAGRRSPELLVLDMRGSELAGELISALREALGSTVGSVTDQTQQENASGAADPSGGASIPEPGPVSALLLPPAVNLGLEEVVAFKVVCGRCGEVGFAEDTRDLDYRDWTCKVGCSFDGALDPAAVAFCPECSRGFENWMQAVE